MLISISKSSIRQAALSAVGGLVITLPASAQQAVAPPTSATPPTPAVTAVAPAPAVARVGYIQDAAQGVYRLATIGEPKMEMQTFLGVGTGALSNEVREQSQLPKGIGLQVSFVEEDSPAAKAGLEEGDVLHKLNDQLLVNLPQLTALIRMNEPDTKVALTVIRNGEPVQLSATLTEKELPVTPNFSGYLLQSGNNLLHLKDGQFNVEGFAHPIPDMPMRLHGEALFPRGEGATLQLRPRLSFDGEEGTSLNLEVHLREMTERAEKAAVQAAEAAKIAGLLARNHAQGNGADAADTAEERARLEKMLAEMRTQLDRSRLELDLVRPGQLFRNGLTEGANIVITDDDGSANMTVREGKTIVRITDADEKVLYDGEWPTKEQIEELPEPAQRRLTQMKKYLPQLEKPTDQKNTDEAEPEAKPEESQPRRPRSGAVAI